MVLPPASSEVMTFTVDLVSGSALAAAGEPFRPGWFASKLSDTRRSRCQRSPAAVHPGSGPLPQKDYLG